MAGDVKGVYAVIFCIMTLRSQTAGKEHLREIFMIRK